MIRNYIAYYIKKIVDNLKLKDPKKFQNEVNLSKMFMQKLAKEGGFGGYLFVIFKYYKITFEDFLYLFLKILSFITGIKVQLDLRENKDIFIRLFYNEDGYISTAMFLGYRMQLKPYSKLYEKFFEICVKKPKPNNGKNEQDDLNIHKNKLANESEKEKLIDKENKASQDNNYPKNAKNNLNNIENPDPKKNDSKIISNNHPNSEGNNRLLESSNNKISPNTNNQLLGPSIHNKENNDILKNKQDNNQIEENYSKIQLLDLERSKILMIDFLKQKFEFDQVDIEDHHYFPPHTEILDFFEMHKFRKYFPNDDIHECADEEQYKLWVNLEDLNRDKDESDIEENEEENVKKIKIK